MHHTLLPLNERRALQREYHVRALTVLCFTLSVAGIIGIGSLFPAYIRAGIEEQSALGDLASIAKAKDVSGLSDIQKNVAAGARLLSALSDSSGRPRTSALVAAVVGQRGNIGITALTILYVSTSTVNVTILGQAPTREALLAFKSRLETEQQGNKVNLPPSTLAQAANIQFSIVLTKSVPNP
ncbi:MAG: hypothetical protein QOG91_626 [Candidatus Parcubacteria bacterium]|jgi:hypothetical protein|nr:hypothetical protein [Candidatus Parcubacteria bacterium]